MSRAGVQRHLITSEYPPQRGGVSDHSFLVAEQLAAAGETVHVWCPPASDPTPELEGVRVHRDFGAFLPADLARVDRELDRFAPPREVVVQWVPHGFGQRSMNVAFCLWIRRRARAGDRVHLLMHETFLAFAGSARQHLVALVHRLMVSVLLRAAATVWTSTPSAIAALRPFLPRRPLPVRWLPVPSNVAVVDDPAAVRRIRERLAPGGEVLLGHFGTFGGPIAELLATSLPELLRGREDRRALLLGRGGPEFADRLLQRWPMLRGRIHATGGLDARELSLHLGACDLLLQPYPEGITTRRGSAMAGLAHGCAILTTSGALTEPLWAESGGVALAPLDDPAALVALAERLLDDPGARARLRESALALYQGAFALEHTVAALRGSYRPPERWRTPSGATAG